MTGVHIVGPGDGKAGSLGGVGVRFMIDGGESGGGFALVEHPMGPRSLAAPMHRHSREDEYSFVLEGRVGADLGGQIVFGEPGDLIFKPRGQWHTFWNPGDVPTRSSRSSRQPVWRSSSGWSTLRKRNRIPTRSRNGRASEAT